MLRLLLLPPVFLAMAFIFILLVALSLDALFLICSRGGAFGRCPVLVILVASFFRGGAVVELVFVKRQGVDQGALLFANGGGFFVL